MLNDLVISIVRGRLLICGLGVRFARGPLLFPSNFTLSPSGGVCPDAPGMRPDAHTRLGGGLADPR
jgi:hypothetical protein